MHDADGVVHFAQALGFKEGWLEQPVLYSVGGGICDLTIYVQTGSSMRGGCAPVVPATLDARFAECDMYIRCLSWLLVESGLL